MSRKRTLLLALLLLPLIQARPAFAHGNHGGGGDAPEAGEFEFTPVVTVEAHGGFETNLDDTPRHYALDGLFGGVFQWGLESGGSISIEAAVGPSLVWGESEHFYGKVHVHDHDEHAGHDDHDDHVGHDDHDDHHDDHDDHAGHDDHDDDHAGHDDHDDHDDHGDHDDHAGHDDHGHGNPDFKRSDVRGYVQVRYAPNDRLSVSVDWKPYYVTQNEGDDVQGLKNELGAEVVWALGDGDVNFSLGDGIEDIVDGLFLSLEHRQGWESDGTWMGNYTDSRVGLGFTIGQDQVNVKLDGGPRFYTPGSYSGLNQRTDFAGELELSVPIGEVVLFAHWQPTYSSVNAPGWGEGWQHHIGTGLTFSF